LPFLKRLFDRRVTVEAVTFSGLWVEGNAEVSGGSAFHGDTKASVMGQENQLGQSVPIKCGELAPQNNFDVVHRRPVGPLVKKGRAIEVVDVTVKAP
jgi:hypothetical protein